jgi:hypothetical protein
MESPNQQETQSIQDLRNVHCARLALARCSSPGGFEALLLEEPLGRVEGARGVQAWTTPAFETVKLRLEINKAELFFPDRRFCNSRPQAPGIEWPLLQRFIPLPRALDRGLRAS